MMQPSTFYLAGPDPFEVLLASAKALAAVHLDNAEASKPPHGPDGHADLYEYARERFLEAMRELSIQGNKHESARQHFMKLAERAYDEVAAGRGLKHRDG